ncbi:HepT-like ribonuclease domain-containing protein [uncultured Parabacteroides sp.]|uniref:HepT-like ribonuclease domain-containing protein n=1 Tax=uncultured Parabacteroides sp. TaxID=512312 RepID=UPI002635BAC3|nr:HepT-like ribonuclease domain-containing protein [uncultured Parabacteroides sp.]
MESISLNNKNKIQAIMLQIEKSILLLKVWNRDIKDVNDFLLSPEGLKDLAANCMLIEAIGEGFKKIDKLTDKKLLCLYQDVIGIRNHIAHAYFDIDTEIIFNVITNHLDPLLDAARFFHEKLSK